MSYFDMGITKREQELIDEQLRIYYGTNYLNASVHCINYGRQFDDGITFEFFNLILVFKNHFDAVSIVFRDSRCFHFSPVKVIDISFLNFSELNKRSVLIF